MKAEQQNIKRLLNTAKGQIDGLNKMIDDDKYCIDIFTQMTVNVKPRSTKYLKCSRKH